MVNGWRGTGCGRQAAEVRHALLSGLLSGYAIAIPVGAIAVLIISLAARTSLPVGAAAGLGAATADTLYALLAVASGAALARVIAPVATPMRWLAALVLLLLAAMTLRTARRTWRAATIPTDVAAPVTVDVRQARVVTRSTVPPPEAMVVAQPVPVPAPGPAYATAPGPAPGPASEPASAPGAVALPPAQGGGQVEALGTPRRAYLGVLGLTLLNPATLAYYAALVLGWRANGGAALSPVAAGVFVAAVCVASASWQLLLACAGSLLGRALTSPRGRIISAGVSSLIMGGLAVQLIISS